MYAFPLPVLKKTHLRWLSGRALWLKAYLNRCICSPYVRPHVFTLWSVRRLRFINISGHVTGKGCSVSHRFDGLLPDTDSITVYVSVLTCQIATRNSPLVRVRYGGEARRVPDCQNATALLLLVDPTYTRIEDSHLNLTLSTHLNP